MLDQMPENLRYYFDAGAFARDMGLERFRSIPAHIRRL
jgi:hypothetical protein